MRSYTCASGIVRVFFFEKKNICTTSILLFLLIFFLYLHTFSILVFLNAFLLLLLMNSILNFSIDTNHHSPPLFVVLRRCMMMKKSKSSPGFNTRCRLSLSHSLSLSPIHSNIPSLTHSLPSFGFRSHLYKRTGIHV